MRRRIIQRTRDLEHWNQYLQGAEGFGHADMLFLLQWEERECFARRGHSTAARTEVALNRQAAREGKPLPLRAAPRLIRMLGLYWGLAREQYS
eukprot:gene8703-4536_t